ncbi:MAG: GNAT family N-acetyltransferase [Streptosporangiaceae bacterium]
MATYLTSQGGTEIREVAPEDDLEALYDLSRRAFGPSSGPPDSSLARASRQALLDAAIDDRRVFAAFDGDQMVASARYHDMRQWWHGRSMPMAGVSGVMVAPEHRGRGLGRKLMTALLAAIASRGYPLSVLYPATTPIYRSLGWELAGGHQYAVIPARSLRALVPPDTAGKSPGVPGDEPIGAERPAPIRRAGPADAGEVLTVIGRAHERARDCGPNTRDPVTIARWLADPELFAYLAADGFLAYHWHGGNDEILVQRAVAATDRTLRDLWSIVASHSSIAPTVRARIGPADPLWWLTREPDVRLRDREQWMLRVVDAPAAIAARGFPASVQLSLPLWIEDDERPGNSGLWELAVTGGRGHLIHSPEATHPVTMGARGFAALYAGIPMATLRLAGLAAGGNPVADSELDGAFAGSSFMLDSF